MITGIRHVPPFWQFPAWPFPAILPLTLHALCPCGSVPRRKRSLLSIASGLKDAERIHTCATLRECACFPRRLRIVLLLRIVAHTHTHNCIRTRSYIQMSPNVRECFGMRHVMENARGARSASKVRLGCQKNAILILSRSRARDRRGEIFLKV